MFRTDNDSLEAQSLRRSGPTAVPQVQAARDAFFAQETYTARGCESAALFDGNSSTYFDANSRYFGTRIAGGCLRIDFGEVYDIDRIEIECFKINTPVKEVLEQQFTPIGAASADLARWQETAAVTTSALGACTAPVVKQGVHTIETVDGVRMKAVYTVKGKARYFRLPDPMDRIYSVKLFDKADREIKLRNPRANNMMAPYTAKQTRASQKITVKLPAKTRDGVYIAVAIEGEHGAEGAYCAAEFHGTPIGFTGRAVSCPVNNWEYIAAKSDGYYTYYLTLPKDTEAGEPQVRELTIYTLFTDAEKAGMECNVYYCEPERTPV
jgi:hypothetical protein